MAEAIEGMEFFGSERQLDEEEEEQADQQEQQQQQQEEEEQEQDAIGEQQDGDAADAEADAEARSYVQPKDRFVTFNLGPIRAQMTCRLCQGVLRDAHTLRECIHSFCKPCLMSYLSEAGPRPACPECGLNIGFQPLNNVHADTVLQALVDKLAPQLLDQDAQIEHDYYASQGMEAQAQQALQKRRKAEPADPTANIQTKRISKKKASEAVEDEVRVLLECHPSEKDPVFTNLQKPFLKTSAKVAILQLKKYVAFKLNSKKISTKDIDILFGDELLGDEHTITFVLKQHRLTTVQQLKLLYRRKKL